MIEFERALDAGLFFVFVSEKNTNSVNSNMCASQAFAVKLSVSIHSKHARVLVRATEVCQCDLLRRKLAQCFELKVTHAMKINNSLNNSV